MAVTGNQVRAGRALLDWTQARLADAAGVHLNTVKNVERARSDGGGVASICLALEGQGVAFIDGGAVIREAA